ncbi:MAG: hypothetical protein AMJ81_10935 [Phycisphaerae bacterium SM23_33]|nr:MAG: hypothetical protein AMJ81_10935 [Phycisphaerae bacterium SM23_33]
MSARAPTAALHRVMLGLALASLASCTWFDSGRELDYIGPAPQPQPAAAPGAAPATAPGRAAPAIPEQGPLALTVREAILLGLENNRALAVERMTTPIRRTFEQQERAVFDPVVGAAASTERTKSQAPSGVRSVVDAHSASASVGTFLPTGTTLELAADAEVLDSSLYSDDLASTRLGLTVTQALLRGAGVQVNLASLRQARLDTLASQYELRGFAESLVADVELTYWGHALARRQIEIYANSLKLAEQQLEEIRERIKIGTLAETELAAAQAEVALRNENLINARSILSKQDLRLLRLLNPPGRDIWGREIILRNQPAVPDVKLDDVEEHVKVALRMRPDVNQARLEVQRGDLEVVKTRNGLLPKMDLFIALGKTGYADSFGQSVCDLDGDAYDVLVGVRFEYPLGNRDAQARHGRAVLSRQQSMLAVSNLAQLVEVDVRSACIEVKRTREQITATAATRKFQAEKLRAETEKFRVGRSTSLLVAQAQRDLLASEIAEIQAVVSYLDALVELHRLEGSLLERRGISAPGRGPVVLEGER